MYVRRGLFMTFGASLFHRPDNIVYVFNVVLTHVRLDTLYNLGSRVGIYEVHGADGNACRARKHELNGILRICDAAHADNRYFHCVCRLINHAHNHRLDCRAESPPVLFASANARL